MSQHRSFLPAALIVAAVATTGCNQGHDLSAAASSTPSACTVALAPFTPRDDADREIARLQDQARGGSQTATALEQLGYRLVSRARSRGDEGDYVLAEQVAACLLEQRPEYPAALLLRGHVLHQMHRFAEAERIARRLVNLRQFVLDYGLLGDTLMERGRLQEAAAAYQKMIDLKPFFQSYTRAAHLRWMRGDLDGALEMVRLAAAAASPRDPESVAWAHSRLAVYELQAGRLNAAERAASTALAAKADYAPALLAKGRALFAQQRAADAIDVLQRAVRAQPLPEYQWALADVLRAADREAEADAVERALQERGPRTDPRTCALFLATRRASVPLAVELARRELAQRADVFTLDALAWSLAAAGRIAEAEPLMARAVAEGTQDGRLFVHAAAIASAAGRGRDARHWRLKAERLRPTLLPSELRELDALPSTPSTQSIEEN